VAYLRVLSWNLPGRTVENHEKQQLRLSVTQPILKWVHLEYKLVISPLHQPTQLTWNTVRSGCQRILWWLIIWRSLTWISAGGFPQAVQENHNSISE